MSRDSQTDTRSAAQVGYTMDFSPTTLQEEVEHNGVLRVNAPVGGGTEEYVNPFGSMRNAGDAEIVARMPKNKRW